MKADVLGGDFTRFVPVPRSNKQQRSLASRANSTHLGFKGLMEVFFFKINKILQQFLLPLPLENVVFTKKQKYLISGETALSFQSVFYSFFTPAPVSVASTLSLKGRTKHL